MELNKLLFFALVHQKRKLEEFIAQSHNKDTSDEDTDEELLVLNYAGTIKSKPQRIKLYVENIAREYNDVEFKQNFRLSREAYHFILSKIIENFQHERENKLLEKQLLSVIWLLATPECFRSVGERFDMAKSSLSCAFFKIIGFLNTISSSIIKWPTIEQMQESKKNFNNKYGLKNIIGAIDGTYVPMKAPKKEMASYTNRKKFTSITLQAICNENMVYLDCFAGFPSSVNDARIFWNSDIFNDVEKSKNSYFPENTCILGDKAYPVLSWLVPPFIDRGNLNSRKKKFNKVQAAARSTVERSFAHLFGRFRRLRYLDMNKVECVAGTILATCVLHNICIKFNDRVEYFVEEGMEVAIENSTWNDVNTDISISGPDLRSRMLNEMN